MVTKREYLIEKGLIKGGRGRWPAVAHKAIEDAINEGTKFEEPEPNGQKVLTIKSKDENGKTVIRTKRVDDVPVVADRRPDRPLGIYTFQNPDGTTFKRSHTEACVRCSMSLGWCHCTTGPILFAYPYAGDEYATLLEIKAVIKSTEVPKKQPTTTTRGGTRRGTGTRRGRPRKA